MLNRTIAPPIKDAIEFDLKLKPYTKYTLKNGVQVYAIDGGAQEVLLFQMVFFAGNAFEKQNGIAAATNALLKNGTSTKTAFQINEQFEFYGAHCNRECYSDSAVLTLHTLTKHLPELLPVMKEMVTDSVFSDNELAIFKQNSLQQLSVRLKKCDFVASRLMDESLFGKEHPYGKYLVAEDYEAITADKLKEFFKQYYVNGELILFVAGKLPADIEAQLNNNFGDLTVTSPTSFSSNLPMTPASEKKYRIQNDPEGLQGAIRIAQPFPNRHHPDFMKAMLLNTVLGGFFGSRLMANIREDKGYTYGIHSFLQNNIQQSAWVISTEAGKDVCEATIAEVYKEMKILREELIDEEELLLVRNYLIGTLLGDLDGPFQIIARWKNLILNGLDEQYFYESIRVIKTLSAEEIRALANKYLHPENFYEIVVI
ncbi:insulinase family protein [Ferruginibacter lapsinanis]|uniref:M16 family metallopeptidase n=1 Tax=Ferruginibacter lapsinanis TaxID=563172 RepID=UPI001E563B5F|nr:pitrilysin family protein [Ferruginibacter lapsinanis]UEG50771.1 insulinase family protein [Ferruginibacter lapsinanis]